jgi:ribosomal protein S18 acetylase RimI-like enzyme
MPEHPLDNPVWHALGGPHRGLGTQTYDIRRYHPEIAAFAAVAQPDAGDFSALSAAVPAGEAAILVTRQEPRLPAGFELTIAGDGLQMLAHRLVLVPATVMWVTLGPADLDEMIALVELTRPGPFARRTPEMGRYIGIREGGRLVAMAGERMHLDGYTEVSAVCTHPDYRGRSYARMLVSEIARAIVERGETPFLHVYATNDDAIATYEKLGFASNGLRRFTFLRRVSDRA